MANGHEDSEDDVFEDALPGEPVAGRGSRRRLMAVAFTSEIFQTLFEDEATLALPPGAQKKVPHAAFGLLANRLRARNPLRPAL